MEKELKIEHKELVRTLVKPGEKVIATLTAAKADMWHAVTGIVGEAGELLDAIKKVVIYNKIIDRQNIVEELGDIEFYMEQLRQRTGITREETIKHNIAKLSARYHDQVTGIKYTDQKAQDRADKNDTMHVCSRGGDGCCTFCGKQMSGPKVQYEECEYCDGCGWYEGGPTLRTTCEHCGGTGRVQK